MRIEKLKKDNRKKIIMGVSIVVLIIMGMVGFVGTKAKYKYTATIPLVSGTIHYKSGDLSVLAVNLENESGTFTESESIPSEGYILNRDKSYCGLSNGDGTYTNEAVTMNYHDGVMAFDNITKKGTKCFLYFNKTAKEKILANNSIDNSRSSGEFTNIFDEDTNGRIFKGPADDYGETTYIFAGSNPNNWVKFAGFYWRIIRINGDGTVRLIYNGLSTDQFGDGTQIGTSAFNENLDDNAYVGYMYGTPGSDNYNDTHANINDSVIKKVVDKWYQDNLLNTEYEKYIDTNVGFCGDRQISASIWSGYDNLGYKNHATVYTSVNRFHENEIPRTIQVPSLKCTNKSHDLYTVANSNDGNKVLTAPIGLITSDEIVFAGGYLDTNISNIGYWLQTAKDYWTMSPAVVDTRGVAGVFSLFQYGGFGYWGTTIAYGVRPVVNIKANTVLSGTGNVSDPFIVN